MYQGGVDEALGGREEVEMATADNNSLEAQLQAMPEVVKVSQEAGKLLVSLTEEASVEAVHGQLISKGVVLTHLFTRRKNLEKQFLDILAASK